MEQLTLTVHERGVHCGLACARSAASFAGTDAGCIDLTSGSSRGSTTSTRLTRATSKPDIPHDRPTQIGHGECWKSTCTPLDTCAGTCMLCANMCGVVRHVSRNMYVGESVAFSWHISRIGVTPASAEHQRTAFESVLDLTALRHRRQVRPTSQGHGGSRQPDPRANSSNFPKVRSPSLACLIHTQTCARTHVRTHQDTCR